MNIATQSKPQIDEKGFKKIISTSVLGLAVIFIGIILFLLMNNESALNSNTYTYFFLIFIPLIIAGWAIMQQDSKMYEMFNPMIMSIIVGVVVFCYLITYLYSQLNSTYNPIINYILNVIIFIGILIALAIIYNLFLNNIMRIPGKLGLFIQLLFHIPCLISDFISYLLYQYKLTPNVVFVLFIIEILIVLLYIYIPKLLNAFFTPSIMVLQNTPIFLDTGVTTLITADKLTPIDSTQVLSNLLNPPTEPANYCISMWIYINPQNKSNMSYTNEMEIFNYGYTDKTGIHSKPRITYKYDPTTSIDTFYLYFTESTDKITNKNKNPMDYQYSISVVGQKWNQFVFNYNNNKVDVFINGHLERTFELTKNLPIYSVNDDKITIGSVKGLDGAICNVTYSKLPLTQMQITNTYNLFMNKNPPINSNTNK